VHDPGKALKTTMPVGLAMKPVTGALVAEGGYPLCHGGSGMVLNCSNGSPHAPCLQVFKKARKAK